MHLVIDGFRGDPAKMWDVELVRGILTDCPDALGMTRITELRLISYDAPKLDESGLLPGWTTDDDGQPGRHTDRNKTGTPACVRDPRVTGDSTKT